MSVDRIYIYMAMGRLRPKDGLISMKDLQVLARGHRSSGCLLPLVTARLLSVPDGGAHIPMHVIVKGL